MELTDRQIDQVTLVIKMLRADADSHRNKKDWDRAGYLDGRADDLEDSLDEHRKTK